MPGIGHLAVGMAAARMSTAPARVTPVTWMCLLIGAAYLPDVDVVAFALGVPYGAPFGHRGVLHSPAFAVLCTMLLGLVSWRLGIRPLRMMLVAGLVMMSHGLLDAFTDGGRGVALLWPLNNVRYFAPWRPIPVSPLGTHAVSIRGWEIMLNEAMIFLPLFLVVLWPQRQVGEERG